MSDTSAEGQDSAYSAFANDHCNEQKHSRYTAYNTYTACKTITNDRCNEHKRIHYTEKTGEQSTNNRKKIAGSNQNENQIQRTNKNNQD